MTSPELTTAFGRAVLTVMQAIPDLDENAAAEMVEAITALVMITINEELTTP